MRLPCYNIFGHGQPIFTADELKQVRLACGIRRADHFTSLAVASVKSPRATMPPLAPETALITASAFGPINTIFQVLDDILDFPEEQLRPACFSHSVHNAAASYLGVALGIRGPVFALTGLEDVCFEAMDLAQTLLDANLAPAVLLVCIDEESLLKPYLPTFPMFPLPPREGVASFLLDNGATGPWLHLDRVPPTRPRLFPFGLTEDFAEALRNPPETLTLHPSLS